MAARKKLWHDPKTREKIKAMALLDRLQRFALGENDNFGQEVKMSQAQVTAALSLVKKVLPDLTAAEIQITDDRIESKEQAAEKLTSMVGEELARKIAPDFFQAVEDISEERTLN